MQANRQQGMVKVPFGVALPWFPHLMGYLPENYLECNGQKVEDKLSPMYGKKLPDLNGAYLVGGAASDSGKKIGSNSASIAADNLPAISFKGTASDASAGKPSGKVSVSSDGAHAHGITDPGHSHATRGSATGLLTGIVGYAMNASGPSGVASNSTSTGISVKDGGAHVHAASFIGDALGNHSHEVSFKLNEGEQKPLDNRPASIVCRWIMRIR